MLFIVEVQGSILGLQTIYTDKGLFHNVPQSSWQFPSQYLKLSSLLPSTKSEIFPVHTIKSYERVELQH